MHMGDTTETERQTDRHTRRQTNWCKHV